MIELLVVVAILALIAGLVGPAVMKHLSGARSEAAVLQIADISAALDRYLIDMGRYPTTAEGLDALTASPRDVRGWNGPYLRSATRADPWGEPYGYRSPGSTKPFELFSFGADRKPGGTGEDADVSNEN